MQFLSVLRFSAEKQYLQISLGPCYSVMLVSKILFSAAPLLNSPLSPSHIFFFFSFFLGVEGYFYINGTDGNLNGVCSFFFFRISPFLILMIISFRILYLCKIRQLGILEMQQKELVVFLCPLLILHAFLLNDQLNQPDSNIFFRILHFHLAIGPISTLEEPFMVILTQGSSARFVVPPFFRTKCGLD